MSFAISQVGTRTRLFFPAKNELKLYTYCDSDWADCPTTRRSITGYCIFLGKSLISWRTRRLDDKIFLGKSIEAEYRSMAGTSCEISWLKNLLHDLEITQREAISLHCDNQAPMHIAANLVFHERILRIEMDCHFIRDKIQEGSIITNHVVSSNPLANVFTKPSGKDAFIAVLVELGVIDIHSPT